MTFFILGNWKANGTVAMLRDFLFNFHKLRPKDQAELNCGLAIPHHLLYHSEEMAPLWQGGEDVSIYGEGAYTGEISASMIRDSGSRFCLVGHSERRSLFGESIADTETKLRQLLSVNVLPVFCIGETLEERREGRLEAVLRTQLQPFSALQEKNCFALAYEPVWAIGTGVAAEKTDVASAHSCILKIMAELGYTNVPVLYGGSVKAKNAAELAQIEAVSGFLVGGASLKPDSFAAIIQQFLNGKGLT